MLSQTPKWWQVYGIVPLAVVLFTAEVRSAMSPTGHRAAEIGIVILVFSLIWLWLKANRAAMIHENIKKLPRTWTLKG